jgi:hypothetical protein
MLCMLLPVPPAGYLEANETAADDVVPEPEEEPKKDTRPQGDAALSKTEAATESDAFAGLAAHAVVALSALGRQPDNQRTIVRVSSLVERLAYFIHRAIDSAQETASEAGWGEAGLWSSAAAGLEPVGHEPTPPPTPPAGDETSGTEQNTLDRTGNGLRTGTPLLGAVTDPVHDAVPLRPKTAERPTTAVRPRSIFGAERFVYVWRIFHSVR